MQIDWDELFREAPRRTEPLQLGRRWLVVALLAGLAFLALGLVGVVADGLWFASIGRSALFRTRLAYPILLFAAVWLVAFAWLAGNWLLAGRRASGRETFKGQLPAGLPLPPAVTRGAVLALAAAVAGFLALGFAGSWETVALWLHRQPFGSTDPLFGLDLGFYVFQLPLWQGLRGLAMLLVLAALAGAGLQYAVGGLVELRQGRYRLDPAARSHLLVLSAVFALLWALGRWLARYELLFRSHTDSFFGPGYADVTARIPAFALLAALGVAVALAFIVAAALRRWRLAAWALAITAGVWLLAGELYPTAVQAWRVRPNELSLERPYIADNIAATRAAYRLDDVEPTVYQPTGSVTAATLVANADTVSGIRLWDWRIFLQTVAQLQAIRSYYGFMDVDIDRYLTADGVRQVNLSLRELIPEALQNPTWVNRHLEYTHGFGAVVSPIAEVEDRGLPVLWLQDIPPVSAAPFDRELAEPRVYFGEATGDDYLVVDTTNPEFDYPSGDRNEHTRYTGPDGVPLGSWWRRILYALRFGDGEILLSTALTPKSRLMMYRNVEARVRELAPFLVYDGDPYPVITAEGHIVWLVDAYTTTDRYPYSTPLGPEAGSGDTLIGTSYVRNSVKVAVDAYTGTASFYVVDPDDPLIRAWSAVFPGLFQPKEAMPPDLVAHWRYPETLFRAQYALFADYHVVDAATFYNAEDRWAIPNETGIEGQVGPMPPYYVSMTLRGEEKPEFVLIVPFSPVGKDNAVGWLAARSDGRNYGRLTLYQFAKGSLVYGPGQIESLIQQDPQISAQVTLWGQSGSQVTYGNLLVIPMGDAILYVEPLYLRAQQGNAVPEMKRVIVAVQDRVVMRPTLDEALAALVGAPGAQAEPALEGAPAAPPAGATPAATAAPARTPAPVITAAAGDVASLVQEAERHEAAAAAALADRDWLTFGREMDELQRNLARLAELTGPTPPP